MARPLPPLNGLRAFEAAARHRSFTAAAAELNVTPAAVSHQVKGLEGFLGVPLFRRLHRGLVLTDAGLTANELEIQEFMILPVGAENYSRALEITTEINEALAKKHVGLETRRRLEDYFNDCDLVKFARFRPAPEDALAAVAEARAIVRSTMIEIKPRPSASGSVASSSEPVPSKADAQEGRDG